MAPVVPSSLVAILLVKSKVYFLTLNGQLAIFDFDICHPCYSTVAPVKYLVIISLFRFLDAFFNRDNLIIKYFVFESPVDISTPRI
jgi:hypothetical protein